MDMDCKYFSGFYSSVIKTLEWNGKGNCCKCDF